MKKYYNQILKYLIEKYNKNPGNQTISDKIEKIVPEFNNSGDYEGFMLIKEAVDTLVKEDIISVKYEKSGRIDRLILSSDIALIHKYAKKMKIYTIDEYFNDCKTILLKYKNSEFEVIRDFCSLQLENIENYKRVKYVLYNSSCNNSSELELILIGATAVLEQKNDILERNFSVNIYNDSKLFRKYAEKIIELLTGDSEDWKKKLEGFCIYQNPPLTMFKGIGTIEFDNGDKITLNSDSPLSLSLKYIESISSININQITSIENLTTFTSYIPSERELVIYLGGFVDSITVNFVKKILSINECNCRHFGDIDAGGFNILIDLESKIEHSVIPYKMSIKEFIENQEHLIELTKNDRHRLQLIQEKGYFTEIIEYMLENNCKLEQENVYQ